MYGFEKTVTTEIYKSIYQENDDDDEYDVHVYRSANHNYFGSLAQRSGRKIQRPVRFRDYVT